MKDNSPPKFPLKLLKWFCNPDYHSNIEGDLIELYGRRVENSGFKKAKRLLYKDVILLFRPGIIRKFKLYPTFNFFIMFRHNLMLTLRTFKRYKTSFLINLIGLSTGLACALLIYLWVNDELQMDKFHEKDEQLYQIMENREQDGGIWTDVGTSGPLAEALRADMPEVEYIAAVGPARWAGFDNFTLSVGERNIRGAGQFVGEDYFNIFSYELIQGHKDQALADKNAIVLSEEMAMTLFNTTEDIIGKAVEFQHEQLFTVTGVFKNIPPNSTVQFDFLLTFETLKEMKPWVDSYGSTGPEIYLILREGTDVDLFNDKLAGFISKLSNNEENSRTLFAKPYSDNYLYGKYENGKQAGGRIEYVRLFSYIAIFILFIACINFMNLSTAQASRKLTEIGIKKVVGAGRNTLIFQYMGESILMALLSLIIAVLIVNLFLPQFNQITGKQLGLSLEPALLLPVLFITLLTGVIAGSYPALYLSGFKPINILKGNQPAGLGEIWSRRGLVTFQFILSIILIVSVGVTYKQIEFVQQQNLGYDRENVIWFDIEGELKSDRETFLSEVKKIPGVNQAAATAHSMIGHNWSSKGLEWEGGPPNNQIIFQIAGVDFDFIETIGVEIREGRSFTRDFGRESEKIIFNEAAIKAMGLKDPIGKTVKTFMGEKEIIGVAKDFHFESFHEEVKPLFFVLLSDGLNKIMVRIKGDRTPEAIASLKVLYESANEGFTFDYKFLDETYQRQYVAEQRVAILSRYFAGLAILISCLGLFGLAAFTAERRVKEIGIRKILGSSVWGIVSLLSIDFTKMVLAAILIAMPLSYLITRNWLEGFAYRIKIEWWFFAGAAAAALLIAWLMVSLQTFKAARVNPVKYLRSE